MKWVPIRPYRRFLRAKAQTKNHDWVLPWAKNSSRSDCPNQSGKFSELLVPHYSEVAPLRLPARVPRPLSLANLLRASE